MLPADEHPFLDAVLASPAADAPRLVYADFLDETGNPPDAARAELIRLQVALARLPADHPRRPELRERETELCDRHLRAWTAPLASLGAVFTFRRGLPDAVTIDAATFLRRGEELFDNTQVGGGRSFVRRVRLLDPARVLPDLVQCPLLAFVEELDLGWGGLGNGGVERLVRSPHLGAVRALDLGFNGLDDAAARAVARASTLPQLQALALNDNGSITGDGAAALADSPFLAGVRELDLSGNDVNEAGVRAVVKGRATARLHALALNGNHIGDAGVAVLVGSELFHRMLDHHPHIDWRRNSVGPAGAAALAESAELARVAGLDLSENYLGDRGVFALCRSGRLGTVRTLRLARNQLTDPGGIALAAAELPKLRVLDVSGNRLTRRGLDALKAAAHTRGFTLEAGGNGTEPTAALAPVPVADVVMDHIAELKRRLAHPARPRE